MSRNRLMLLLAAVASLAILAGGFFLGVQPQLDRAAAADAERGSVAGTNASTRTELDRLCERAAEMPRMQAELAELRASVPADAQASALISQLDATADTSGVRVSSLTIGDAQAYVAPAATPATGSDGGSTGTGTPGAATAAPTAQATAAATPVAPRTTTDGSITSANFSVIPVTVTVEGDFAQALAFVRGVQSNPRLFLVTAISSAAAESGADDGAAETPTWTFSGSVYVLAGDPTAARTAG